MGGEPLVEEASTSDLDLQSRGARSQLVDEPLFAGRWVRRYDEEPRRGPVCSDGGLKRLLDLSTSAAPFPAESVPEVLQLEQKDPTVHPHDDVAPAVSAASVVHDHVSARF